MLLKGLQCKLELRTPVLQSYWKKSVLSASPSAHQVLNQVLSETSNCRPHREYEADEGKLWAGRSQGPGTVGTSSPGLCPLGWKFVPRFQGAPVHGPNSLESFEPQFPCL